MNGDDFASMMESAAGAAQSRASRRLKSGQVVEGTVVQITKDSVFVDVGATTEGRIDRGELEDKKGALPVKIGDSIKATVARVDDAEGPLLVVSLGRGKKGGVDVSALEDAKESGIPVEGTVSRVVKGGLEVQVGGARAFCPASQVDATYVKDLSGFANQTLSFRVVEVRDGGKSIVLSRRALLEEERAKEAEGVVTRLKVGSDFEGTVSSVQKYGAFVDVGAGVEGLVHISEIAHSRIDRVEDVLTVGEKVTVRLLAIEPPTKGDLPKLRLSLKALSSAPQSDAPAPGEVLVGKVSSVSNFGVFVETTKGTGLVPQRELGLPRGADHRKLLPVETEVKVVLVNKDAGGKITFSMGRVAGVEERQNYREFTKQQKPSTQSASVGSLGLQLKDKLGLNPEAVAAAAKPASPPRGAQHASGQPARARGPRSFAVSGSVPPQAAAASSSDRATASPVASKPAAAVAAAPLNKAVQTNQRMPEGVTRRRR